MKVNRLEGMVILGGDASMDSESPFHNTPSQRAQIAHWARRMVDRRQPGFCSHITGNFAGRTTISPSSKIIIYSLQPMKSLLSFTSLGSDQNLEPFLSQ